MKQVKIKQSNSAKLTKAQITNNINLWAIVAAILSLLASIIGLYIAYAAFITDTDDIDVLNGSLK
ncbi:hypothetical protein J2Z69_000293 [Paenibacillus shirakamiensis]|uniref:Uncharacterized protein n=1 Tax=Paenibacillus shirakamiensis TaxID=1265935 RepID=A0ABS4JFB1_9BACL|nr:hypothetical protein [Paenibacillus shirakamiensis]MBP1999274.1 hypothetical protein [Paenibacillus shirakamiensis]